MRVQVLKAIPKEEQEYIKEQPWYSEEINREIIYNLGEAIFKHCDIEITNDSYCSKECEMRHIDIVVLQRTQFTKIMDLLQCVVNGASEKTKPYINEIVEIIKNEMVDK